MVELTPEVEREVAEVVDKYTRWGVRRYRHTTLTEDEIRSACGMGAAHALATYDEAQGAGLRTWLVNCVMHQMMEDVGGTYHLSRSRRRLADRERQREGRVGRSVRLSERMVVEEEPAELPVWAQPCISLKTTVWTGEEGSTVELGDVLVDPEASADGWSLEECSWGEIRGRLREGLPTGRLRFIAEARFLRGWTVERIARRLGLSRSYVDLMAWGMKPRLREIFADYAPREGG